MLVIAVPIIILASIVGALAGAALLGAVYITPQAPWLILPSNPGGVVHDSLKGFLPPPLYAVMHELPNGSVQAEVWVYNPNSVPAIFNVYINPVSPTNNTRLWWGPDIQPVDPRASRIGEVCGFDFGRAPVYGVSEWGGETANSTYSDVMLIPPGLIMGPGWRYLLFATEGYPSGTYETVEYFRYIGNGTWVATPPFAVHQQEIPPDFPYRNLVNVTSAPLPSWWGRRSIPPCYPPGF